MNYLTTLKLIEPIELDIYSAVNIFNLDILHLICITYKLMKPMECGI